MYFKAASPYMTDLIESYRPASENTKFNVKTGKQKKIHESH